MPILIIVLIIIFLPSVALIGGFGLGALVIFGIPIILVVLGVLWLLLQPIIFVSEYKERKERRERHKKEWYNRKHGIVTDEQFDIIANHYCRMSFPLHICPTYNDMTKNQRRTVLNKIKECYPRLNESVDKELKWL